MGLQLPPQLTEPLGWVGLTWPEADEELLFDAGQQWIAYAERLHATAAAANQAAAQVWSANEGEATDAFNDWWEREDGPNRRLSDDAQSALLIGAALISFAVITLAMKVAFIVQLIALAIEVAQAIATAFVSFGATLAEVPGFIAATRILCKRLIQQVIDHITTVIKDIFEQAKDLLRVGKGFGRKQAAREMRSAAEFEAKLIEDLAKANPRFDPSDPAYAANCVHCVQAFELRRRGYAATATALPREFRGFGGRPRADIVDAWGRPFTGGSKQAIEQAFTNFGPGSRGVVSIRWNNGGGGHVFNVENVGGRIQFLDAQINLPDATGHFLDGYGMAYIRLDDLPVGWVRRFARPTLGR